MTVDASMTTSHHSNIADLPLPPPLTTTTWLLVSLTFLAVLGGFTFGYDTGIVSGAMIIMRTDLELDDLWQELIVTMVTVGAAVSSIFGGVLNSKFGKKYVILLSCLSYIVGAVICAFSPSRSVLLLGRIILGMAIGICACTSPSYISECSPIHIRGRLLTMWQLLIDFGFFASSILAAALSYITNHNLSWRLMLGLAGVPAAIQFIGFCFMPESPRWLITHGREDEGVAIMKRIYGNDEAARKNAEYELLWVKEAEEKGKRERAELGKGSNRSPVVAAFQIPHIRKALIIGCSLQIWQQLSGINTIMYYSASIVTMAGISDPTTAMWLAALPSGTLFIGGILSVYLVEKIGRRPLVVWSGAGTFICLIVMGVAFTVLAEQSPMTKLSDHNISFLNEAVLLFGNDHCTNLSCDACSYKIDCGFCFDTNDPFNTGSCVAHSKYPGESADGRSWAAYGRCTKNLSASTNPSKIDIFDAGASWYYGFCPTTLSWLPILGMVLYILAFSIGYAPMPWAVNAELYPNWARSTGTAISSVSVWIVNIVVSISFLSLARAITRQGTYFLYAGITLIGVIWFYLVMPETKGKDIEEIQFSLMGPWCSRGRVSTDAEIGLRQKSKKKSDAFTAL